MREEGHSALVHTAAASQLGQMLLRVCIKDNIPLVNIVRRPEQEALLREIDPSAIIVSQSKPTFKEDLAKAIQKTQATLGFDATGGGSLSADILNALDAAGQTRKG